jgi:uncharacterized protein
VGSARGDADVARFTRIHTAIRSGDMTALVDELGADPNFPNVIPHLAIGSCLTYAIYHAPIGLVSDLLLAGADPNWPADDGFPPLIAAVTCGTEAPGATIRPDVQELVDLLVAQGANVDQRGFNDYTPLHLAAEQGNLGVVEKLLAHGADPDAITRIDDCETALAVARKAGQTSVVQHLGPLTTR